MQKTKIRLWLTMQRLGEFTFYIFESLLSVDRITTNLSSARKKSLPEISDDHLSYTFELKENITFLTESRLTSEDDIYNWQLKTRLDAKQTRNYFEDVEKMELENGKKILCASICRSLISELFIQSVTWVLHPKIYTWTKTVWMIGFSRQILKLPQNHFDAKKISWNAEICRLSEFRNSFKIRNML